MVRQPEGHCRSVPPSVPTADSLFLALCVPQFIPVAHLSWSSWLEQAEPMKPLLNSGAVSWPGKLPGP